jgi:heavy metal translocating P-type ATPase
VKKIPRYKLDTALAALLALVLLAQFGFSLTNDTPFLIFVACVGFAPVLWGALKAFRGKEWASMDLLASVALIFSLLNVQWVSAIFIELMLASARILDDVTRDSTEKSIRGLLKLRPEKAAVEERGELVKMLLSKVKVGDTVVVDIGERVPVDGVILAGTGAVDESSLTGESLPVDKKPGDKVMSSTLLQAGNLRVKTTHTGKDTTLERIINLVESARAEKPSSQTLGERFGKIYLIAVFAGSAALWALTQNLPLVLSVVLVVCADDIAVAIPIAYLRAIRAAAGEGIIVKGSKHLELFGQIKTIVFDKTGTLTKGALAVTGAAAAEGHTEKEVLEAAVLPAQRSSHPLSRAIVAHAKAHHVKETLPDSVEEHSGKGVVATKGKEKIIIGKHIFFDELKIKIPEALAAEAMKRADAGASITFVAAQGAVIGFVAAADEVKKNAKEALAELRALGITTIVMLTGDNRRAAAHMARELGIVEWHADLLPQDKVRIVKELQSKRFVAMVGDGVNDAAALSVASVGVAMGGLGTEGAIDAAQIVLMRDDLSMLPQAVKLARLAREVSMQDFIIWGLTNAAGLLVVFAGFIGPSGAAAYNFLSDFLPLFNSLRIRMKPAAHRRLVQRR